MLLDENKVTSKKKEKETKSENSVLDAKLKKLTFQISKAGIMLT
jgi:hypothetical protein